MKKPANFKLSKTTITRIEELAVKLSVSKTAIVEMGVAKLYEAETRA